jgi:hypothetical protein
MTTYTAEQYAAIGRIAVAFGAIEDATRLLLGYLTSKVDDEIAAILTDGDPFGVVLTKLERLGKHRLPTHLSKRMSDLVKRVTDGVEERNMILHSGWRLIEAAAEGVEVPMVKSTRKGGKRRIRTYTASELERIADGYRELLDDMADMINEVLRTPHRMGSIVPTLEHGDRTATVDSPDWTPPDFKVIPPDV